MFIRRGLSSGDFLNSSRSEGVPTCLTTLSGPQISAPIAEWPTFSGADGGRSPDTQAPKSKPQTFGSLAKTGREEGREVLRLSFLIPDPCPSVKSVASSPHLFLAPPRLCVRPSSLETSTAGFTEVLCDTMHRLRRSLLVRYRIAATARSHGCRTQRKKHGS